MNTGVWFIFIYVFQQVLGNDIAVYHVRSNEVRYFFFNIFVIKKIDDFCQKELQKGKTSHQKMKKGNKMQEINSYL
jgi:hypothetical protein